MKIVVLSSGSKGNSTYIETKNHKILIDIGTSSLYVEKSLRNINVDPKDIDTVLITHCHKDHIAGLKVFSKKYHPNIYLDSKVYEQSNIKLENINFICNDFILDEVNIAPIKISHDVEAYGYIISENNKSLVYITDTGYINQKYFDALKNKDIYIIESNHDVEMLMNNSKYPHHLKIRILSDRGHLSNKDCSYYLSSLIGDKTKYIILAHLSEENNTKEKARETLNDTLNNKNIKFSNIIIAEQKKETELIEV